MKIALLLIAIVILAGIYGNADYKNDLADQKQYCKNVESGKWPDFDHIYKSVCATPRQAKSYQNFQQSAGE